MDYVSFGQWLQQCRKRQGLTQADLGSQVGCSAGAIRKIEADERRPSKDVAERLANVLLIPAEEHHNFVRFARGEISEAPVGGVPAGDGPSPWRPEMLPPSNLPALSTPLIGRERESVSVIDLLRRPTVRLLTLTGPGGIGKTRLALHSAEALRTDFAHGVWFVAVAPIRDVTLVGTAIAQALGVKEGADQSLQQTLEGYLRDKQLLLVLDNFEQVSPAARLINDLLVAAPAVKVLVTSRVLLHLSIEHEFRVPPLELPNLASLPALEALSQYEAVALFITRAQLAQPDFQITNTTAPTVAEICHRLDGLPLAIELAAARSRVLPPRALLQRLSHRLSLLHGGPLDLPARQQTLRNTIEWSYQLLDPVEQTLFTRLAVFVGTFSLAAAEHVCAMNHDVGIDILDGIQSLVEKSLVRRVDRTADEPRFRMLETIREYAGERLDESSEGAVLRQQHAAYYMKLVEAVEPQFNTREQVAALQRLAPEHDNIRTAMQWATLNGSLDGALRIGGALGHFWEVRGHWTEGRTLLEAALNRLEQEQLHIILPIAPAVHAKALVAAGSLARLLSDVTSATRYLQQALALYQQQGDVQQSAWVLGALGVVAHDQGDIVQAREYYLEALKHQREASDLHACATTLALLGRLAYFQGEYEQSRVFYEESLTYCQQLNDKRGIGVALNGLAHIARYQGLYDRAEQLRHTSLMLFEELGDQKARAWTLQGLGDVARDQGDAVAAAEYFSRGLALAQDVGDQWGVAWALLNLGLVAYDQRHIATAAEYLEDALARFQALRDQWGIPWALVYCGRIAIDREQYTVATDLFHQSIKLLRRWSNKAGCAVGLEGLAIVAHYVGHSARAAHLFTTAAELRAEISLPYSLVEQLLYERHLQIDRAVLNIPQTPEHETLTLDDVLAAVLAEAY